MRILCGPGREPFVTFFFRLEESGHDVLTFDDRGPGLHYSGDTGTFEQVLDKLPEGWTPDLVIWWLPEFQCLVPGVENCPYPTALVVSDWHFFSDPLLDIASMFDVVATDIEGVRLLQSRPEVNAFHAQLYGYVPALHRPSPATPSYDVSFVGDLHPYLRRDRVATLARLAEQLSPERTLRIFQDVFLEPYVDIVNSSRISINVSQRGEMNMRCFEVVACGSLLFCEDSNREMRSHFEDRVHCVYFNDDNLVELCEYYLDHEDERLAIVEAAQSRLKGYSYAELGQRLVGELSAHLPGKGRAFLELSPAEQTTRWANYAYHVRNRLPPRHAARFEGDSPEMCNILGCEYSAQAAASPDLAWRKPRHLKAIELLQRALPLGLLPHLSLAQVMLDAGHKPEAFEVLQKAAEGVEFKDVAFFPREREPLSVLWESDREHREKSARWCLYDMLSQLHPDRALEYCDKALSYRDDMPMTWFRRSWHVPPDSAECVTALERCCQLAPTFAWSRFVLARKLVQRHRLPEAVGLLQRTSELILRYPYSPLVKQALDRNLNQLVGGAAEVKAPGERLEDLLAAISFRWLNPEDPLPGHLKGWVGTELEFSNTDFGPYDRELKARFLRLDPVPRMSSLTIAAVLWWSVRHMPADQCYVNVGVWNGFTFLSGLIDNPDKVCIGVDNFCEFDGPKEAFTRQFERFRSDQHHFFEMDYQAYFAQQHQQPIGVYLYDGMHSYDHQYRGLEVAERFFAPGCIVVVDDTNWEPVTQANEDFIRNSKRSYEKLFEMRTTAMKHPTWWNGIQVWRCLE